MLDITPKTKVGELLDNYPQLEEVLLQLSPAFASLKNPILRRTVAKVATLQQASAIGNLNVRDFVNQLRFEVGKEPLFDDGSNSKYVLTEPPAWYDANQVSIRFDARGIIASGGSPMNQILEETKTLKPGEIYELVTPFVPVPIIDMLVSHGFEVASLKKGEQINSYIRKASAI
jgi:hypothetical protein